METLFLKLKNVFLQQKRREYLPLLMAITAYDYLILLWHHYNKALPTSDAVTYLSDAYYRYYNFFDHGIISGIVNLYLKRGWRPQIFPDFSVPFLLLFGNNPFNAIMSVSVLFGSLLILYLYLFLRINLSPLYAAITAIFIGTYPLIFNYNLIFFSEISYLPFVLATFYHLLKSDYFSNHKHSLLSAIFAGLLICIRPAESIMFLLLALLPFLFFAIKNKNLGLKELLISLNIEVATIVLLLYLTYTTPNEIVKYALALIVAVYSIKKLKDLYKNKANPFIIFSLTLCIAIFIYWIPSVDALINWSLEASVGSVVKSLGVVGGVSTSEFILTIFSAWSLMWVSLLILVPIIFLPSNLKNIINTKNITIFLSAFLPIVFLAFSYKLSINDAQIVRRSLGMGLLASVLLASLIFNNNNKYKFLPLIFIVAVLSINIFSIISSSLYGSGRHEQILSKSETNLQKISLYKTYYSKPAIPRPNLNPIDQHILLANIITKNLCKYDKNCGTKYRSFFVTLPVNFTANAIDPFTSAFASSILNRNEKNFYFGLVFMPKEADPYALMKDRGVNFVIVQDRKDFEKTVEDVLNNKDLSPSQKFTAKLIKEYHSGRFEKLKLIDSFDINDSKILVLANPDVPL